MSEPTPKTPPNIRFTRRALASLTVGGLAGETLLEAAVQETRTTQALSLETVRVLLEFLGQPAANRMELERMRPALERTVRAIQVIRDFEIPLTLEPAFVFHPDGGEDERTP